MDPLPFIADFLHMMVKKDRLALRRCDFIMWIKGSERGKELNDNEVDLLVDVFIRAGIGKEWEAKNELVCCAFRIYDLPRIVYARVED